MFEMADRDKNEIIGKYSNECFKSHFSIRLEFLSKAPSNLTIGDLEDFCSLANHYASTTPQSFRKVTMIKKKKLINIKIFFFRNFIHVYLM
jgi:hypothetical protein